MEYEVNPTIKAPYRLGMTKDELQFIIHVLDQHRNAQLDSLMEIDEATDYDKVIMAEIQMCEDMISKILRKMTETNEMKARREYFFNKEYAAKQPATVDGNKPLQTRSKLMISSLYGKIGMYPNHRDNNEVQL